VAPKAPNQANVRATQVATGAVRGRPRSERAHRAILEAALDLPAEHGMSGLTMEGVAARAGIGKRTLYRRWRSKVQSPRSNVLVLSGSRLGRVKPERGQTSLRPGARGN
jgi:hypothetical protein